MAPKGDAMLAGFDPKRLVDYERRGGRARGLWRVSDERDPCG